VIKTIIFDLDGTLIDSEGDLARAVNHALKAIGEPRQPQARITSFIGNGLRFLLINVLGPGKENLFPQARVAFNEYYLAHCTDKTKLYPGVLDFLKKYSPKLKMAIVTNKPQVFAEKIAEDLGIDRYFSLISGGDSFPKGKPHPQPLLEALAKMGGKPETSLMVGDGPQDLEAGKAAGIKTCVVRYGFGFKESLIELIPDFVIDQFKELENIVP